MYFDRNHRHLHFLARITPHAIVSPITHHPNPIRRVVMPEPTRKGVALSSRQLDIILTRFVDGTKDHSGIAAEVGCSLSCIRQKSVIYNNFGTVIAPKSRSLGRPRLVSIEAEEVLDSLHMSFELTPPNPLCERLMQALRTVLEEEPYMYRDEMQEFLLENFNLDVSVWTISRTLKKMKLSRKKAFVASMLLIIATTRRTAAQPAVAR